MTDVFLTVLRMSLTGSVVILAVLLVRLCLKKAPKRWSWALWLIVLFRLLTPFGIPLSVPMPALSAGTESARMDTEPPTVSESSENAVPSPGPADPAGADDPSVGAGESSVEVYAPDPSVNSSSASGESAVVGGPSLSEAADPIPETESVSLWDRVLTAAPFVWLTGAAVLAGWNLLSYRKLKKRLSEAVPSGGVGLYLTDRVDTAFVVGLIRPRIYLPTGLNPVEQACVAAHERVHIRRLDPWWRFFSFLALTAHWFNPLVWLAFSLSGKDMELSCDEAVLNRAMNRAESRPDEKGDTSDAEIRAAYAKTLLKFASRGRIAGPALAFGEGETTSRVKNVMRYKKPVLWVSIAAGLALVLSAVVLAVNLTARNTKLPHAMYAAKEVAFFDLGSPDISEETADGLRQGIGQLRWMLAGDGTLYVTGPGMADWYTNEFPGGGTEQWILDGTLVSDRIRGIDSPEDVTEMIRETAGVKIGRIVDAVVSITEPYSPNHSSYDTLFSTADGKIWAASIGGRENLERGNAVFLIELAPEKGSGTGGGAFFSKSLHKSVSELLSWEEMPEVFIYNELRDREDRTILLFMAGEQVSARIGQPDNETPFHFGIAVFLPEADGVGLRLADCQICPDVTVTRQFRDAGFDEPQEPGTVRRVGDDFVFLTEDGQSIRAKLTLPKRKKTLLGRTEYVGECAIRFPGNAEEAYEVPAFLDALPYTRYSVDEVLYHTRDLTPEQTEFLSSRRFEIAGNCSLWVTDWEDTWSYIGKGTLNPSMGGRSVEEWILAQTGVEVELVKEARLFSGQMHSGTILFSTRNGGFYAASVYPGDEPDSLECRSLFRLRCEEDPGNRLWIDEGFAERTLQSALERDVHVPELHTAYPPGIAVVPFVAGMMWKDISGLVMYDAAKISCQIGAAVFELGSRSARLLKWSVFEDVSFTGWYPDGDMITCAFPSDDTLLFTLPDGTEVRADITLPERETMLFGLIERNLLVGECAIRFVTEPSGSTEDASPAEDVQSPDPEGENHAPTEGLDASQPELDALYDAFVAEHYDPDNWQTAAYIERRIDLDRNGLNELILYRSPTEAACYLDIYTWEDGEIRAFHTALEGIPASRNADPEGRYCAAVTAGNSTRSESDPDGFYSDFFSVNGDVFLIAMDASEFWQIIHCYAFGSTEGALSATRIFSAERYGEFVPDETKKNKAFVNGQEIPYEEYGGALLAWRDSWRSSMNGGVLTWFTPNEYEVSGWPFGWNAEQRMKTGETYFPLGHFTMTHPAQWRVWMGGEPGGNVEWLTEPTDGDGSFGMWIQFLFRDSSGGYSKTDTLGWLMLYPHHLGRIYTSPHQELKTAVFPDGTAWDLAIVFPNEDEVSPENEGSYVYELQRLRSAAATIRFDDDCRVTLPFDTALTKLTSALRTAFTNTYGYDPEPPIEEDPSPATDEEYLRWAIYRFRGDGEAAGAWEDEQYYWFPVIFPFAVDKETGEIYKVYEGWDPAANEAYTHFTPFDPADPYALSFAG